MVDPRFFAPADLGAAYMRGVQMREHREDRQNKRRLGELIPQALGRGGMSEEGALGKDAALDEIYKIDPQIGMRLDDHQRKVAQDVVGDLSNAVRWADTPEKWSEVQAFYATRGVDLSRYEYGQRDRSLMALGQLGEYLKGGPKPSNGPASVQEYQFAKEQGFSGSYMDFLEGKKGPIVANNGDGTFTLIPRSYGGQPQQPQASAAPPPPPGFVVDGGPTPRASGNFPATGP